MLQFGPTFERLSTLVDKARTVKKPRCLNPTCALHGNVESTGIIRYGFYRTTAGKRRRSRCIGCGQTFSTTKGTPYDRLQHRRATFDSVVTLRVEGVSLSAIGCLRHSLLIRQPICVRVATRTMTARLG